MEMVLIARYWGYSPTRQSPSKNRRVTTGLPDSRANVLLSDNRVLLTYLEADQGCEEVGQEDGDEHHLTEEPVSLE